MIKIPYHLLDVFTDKQFCGNQLAIFPDSTNIDESIMQTIAKEFNLSETVFLYPQNTAGAYKMRIFTPTMELPTAGHPTIGSAYYIASQSSKGGNSIEILFDQKVGRIKVEVLLDHQKPVMAYMNAPLPEFGKVFENREDFANLLSISIDRLLEYPIQIVSCGVPFVIIPAITANDVSSVKFKYDQWEKMIDSLDNAFIFVFAPEGKLPLSSLHGRMFAPQSGIIEDPATGSAHGPLGSYVVKYGIKHSPLICEQGFEIGRPSILHVEIGEDSNRQIRTVKVGGQSVFVANGEFYIDL